MDKRKTTIVMSLAILALLLVSLLPAKYGNTYSYLPNPPVSMRAIVAPDKEIYQAGDIIKFVILAVVDTLHADARDNYVVYFGAPGSLLSNCEFVDSSIREYYLLSNENPVLAITFTLKMIRADNPPDFKATVVRLASEKSIMHKQFREYVIDEYAVYHLTSTSYAKALNSGYGASKD